MFDFLSRKKRAQKKHERELKARLARKLLNYDSVDDKSVSEFTVINFGEGKKKVRR
jgi:hypothetical protein